MHRVLNTKDICVFITHPKKIDCISAVGKSPGMRTPDVSHAVYSTEKIDCVAHSQVQHRQ